MDGDGYDVWLSDRMIGYLGFFFDFVDESEEVGEYRFSFSV